MSVKLINSQSFFQIEYLKKNDFEMSVSFLK